jgi:S-adenosylmethionine/arginine decarboxylase-like enzyme
MSFTEDELQAFNAILDQRLAVHRQEIEQALARRLDDFRRDMTQHLSSFQKETISVLGQHLSQQDLGTSSQDLRAQLEAIEVQTDLPWEELATLVGKQLDERLTALHTLFQHTMMDLEQQLATQLRNLHAEIAHAQRQPYGGQGNDGTSIIPEVLTAVEHLERVIESMQVAMTANHALLSNRLYHHQQLPLERAHPLGPSRIAPSSEATSLLAQAKARVAGGLEPLMPSQQDRNEETQEH